MGRVLIVGGSANMAGAPALAGLGALRAGAGLVKVAVPRPVQATVAGFLREVTTAGLPAGRTGGLGAAAGPIAREMLTGWDALVLGPGAGRAPATARVIRTLSLGAAVPLVLDADGLHAWNERGEGLQKRKAPTVLTPHEGEAARLLGLTSEDIRSDREGMAARLALACGAVVVLKGPGTLVTDGTRLYRNRNGGPVLATGGTGDVLAGIMGALLAQLEANRTDAFQAACAAVHVHGASADQVAGARDRGLLASELAAKVPEALSGLSRGAAR